MKKILKLFILIASVVCVQTYAKENNYYINDNNVSFSKEQYEYFTAMFYDGYQNLITQEEFNTYDEAEMKAENVETKYVNSISPLSTLHETTAKQLKISKSVSSTAKISVVLTWKGTPKVKSYDVIGSYLEGVSSIGNVITRLSYGGGSYDSNEIKSFNNGFGVSIKLPSSGSNIIVSQSFSTTLGGTVYASYQYATSSISLASSKYYTISKSGYGKVFSFYNNMSSKYDGMGGVYIDV